MSLLGWLNRLNAAHPWSHNDFYGPWVVRQVASSGARTVLDVGCGTGDLLARLIPRAVTLTGLEPHDATAKSRPSDSKVQRVYGFGRSPLKAETLVRGSELSPSSRYCIIFHSGMQ